MLEFATCEKELEHTDFVAFVCQLDGGLKHVVQFEFSVGIERVLENSGRAGHCSGHVSAAALLFCECVAGCAVWGSG